MKIEPVFTVSDRTLTERASGAPYDCAKLVRIPLQWSDVEPAAPEAYDEAFLAELRLKLKAYEENPGKYAIIVPSAGEKAAALASAESREQYIAALNHAARRIKDCAAVIGFAVPQEFTDAESATLFMERLLQKHSHYVFFAKESQSAENMNIVLL